MFYVRSATPAKFDLGDVIKTLFFQDFSGKTFHLQDIPLSWAVSTLQNHMAVARGYDPSELRLIWAGKPLESGKSCRGSWSISELIDRTWTARTLDSYAVPNVSYVPAALPRRDQQVDETLRHERRAPCTLCRG